MFSIMARTHYSDCFQGFDVPNWFRLPRCVVSPTSVDLTGYERWALVCIFQMYPMRDFRIESLSTAMGMGVNTAARALKGLVDKGYVTRECRPGKVNIYDYKVFLKTLVEENNIAFPEVKPPVAEPRVAEPKPESKAESQKPQEQPSYDPYEGLTEQDRGKINDFVRNLEQQSWDVGPPPPPAPPGAVKWQDLGASDLQSRLRNIRQKVASLWYPGVGDQGAEQVLHDAMEGVYAAGPTSHFEAWGAIEKAYVNYVLAQAKATGYDRVAENRRINNAYALYLERESNPLEFMDFIDRFYRCHEFREYDGEEKCNTGT